MTAELTSPGAEFYCPSCEQVYAHGTSCPDDGTRLVHLTAPSDPFLGRELDGRYTIIEKLGQGGMGAVYRARQHSMGREVAIKVLTPSLVRDPHSIKRFLREAKLASRLAHPNVVAVLDFGQASDGVFYLVMELVVGRTLHDLLVAEGRLPLARLIRIAVQICDALEGAHALPIVHRDLKPANVMLLATGRDLVKVLDFGLAKSLSVDASNTTMTGIGALLGTPTFMPPEVANGDFVDDRADLYSLGCMLYMMASGHPPFVTDSVPEMISMHGSTPAPPVTGVARPLAAVIDRLLHKSPDGRYPSAAAVREALEAAVDEIRRHGADPDTDPSGDDDTLDAQPPPNALPFDSGVPSRPSDRSTTVFSTPVPRDAAHALAPSLLGDRNATTLRVTPRGPRRGAIVALVGLVVCVISIVIVVAIRRSAPPPTTSSTSIPENAGSASLASGTVPVAATPDAATPDATTPDAATPDAALSTTSDLSADPTTRPRPRPRPPRTTEPPGNAGSGSAGSGSAIQPPDSGAPF